MKSELTKQQWDKVRQRKFHDEERMRHDREVALIAAILLACPELSRGKAAAEAVRILNKRRGA